MSCSYQTEDQAKQVDNQVRDVLDHYLGLQGYRLEWVDFETPSKIAKLVALQLESGR